MAKSLMERDDLREYAELLPDEYAERFDSEGATYEIGPIDPDTEALADQSRRTVVRRQTFANGKRFPFPIPNGWFVVSESRALERGEVKSLSAFGKDLVLYRDENGAAQLIDAYCPHLGAHIGAGGKVEGGGIRCPFHGWLFESGTGKCIDVPYVEGRSAPGGARIRSYPVIERNHMVWAWHHLEEGEPFYDVPEVPQFNDPEWLPYELKVFEIRTCIQEMAENDADLAHFKYVHGSPAIPEGKVEIEGTTRRSISDQFIRENVGLGLAVLQIGDVFRFMSSSLPLDEETTRLYWWFTAPAASGAGAAKIIAEAFFTGVSQDLAIWENKRFQPKPQLTADEKKIIEFRRWAKQFYSGYDGP